MAPSGRASFMLPLKVETLTCKEVNLVVKLTQLRVAQLRVEIIALCKAKSHLARQLMLSLFVQENVGFHERRKLHGAPKGKIKRPNSELIKSIRKRSPVTFVGGKCTNTAQLLFC